MLAGDYAIASRLVGFERSTLRVRIERFASESIAIVRTADIADTGTPLVLKVEQLRPELAPSDEAVRHRSGLVWIGGVA